MYAPRTELGLVVRGVTLLLVLCGGLEPVWTRIFHNSISVTHHSSLITHHLKYHVCLAPSLTSHRSIFFTLFVDPIPVTGAAFLFLFFFFFFC